MRVSCRERLSGMPGRRAIGIPDQIHDIGSRRPSRLTQTFTPTPISSDSVINSSTMLRFTFLATRPLSLGKSATVTLRPVARNFSSFGSKTSTSYFNAASNRSRQSPSSFWSKWSRTFMTDSSAVTVRPTQAEVWRKYAVTAVSPFELNVSRTVLLTLSLRLLSPEPSSPRMYF